MWGLIVVRKRGDRECWWWRCMMREGKKGCTFKVNYFFDDVGKCIINDSLRGDPQ